MNLNTQKKGGFGSSDPANQPGAGAPDPETQPLLTIPQAAHWLNMGKATVYRLLDRGALTSIRIGRARRIAVSDLKMFIEGCREKHSA
jgi:excisionase family DNA binding protein